MNPTSLGPTHGDVRPNGVITCRRAVDPADRAEHSAIRRAVFVDEQRLFSGSDHDAHDEQDDVVYLLARYDGLPAGSVRLFPLDPPAGVWQGDRLCVLPPYRVHGVGAPLVRCAVAEAATAGGTMMVAHIQLPNVAFFTHLGWHLAGDPESYVGVPHQPMAIALPSPSLGRRTVAQLAHPGREPVISDSGP